MEQEMLKSLEDAVVAMKIEDADQLSREITATGISAADILNKALIPALDRVGTLFGSGEYFLPEMLMCVHIYNGIFERIETELKQGNFKFRGRVMLGSVEGDTHDIGKNIVAALLQGNGFEVIDLGINVSAKTFLEKAKEVQPQIIGMSALLTTTMVEMKKVIDLFNTEGVREQYRLIVGGAPVSREFAEEIGADGYGREAQAGVELVKRLIA
jgi:5-methyltetrahydrofolate--homocysteine methyltransferase